jgi:hypothetical protein
LKSQYGHFLMHQGMCMYKLSGGNDYRKND